MKRYGYIAIHKLKARHRPGPAFEKCRHFTVTKISHKWKPACNKNGPLEPCDSYADASKDKPDIAGGVSGVYSTFWSRTVMEDA